MVHEEALWKTYGHDDPAEGGWVLVWNHVEMQSYNLYSHKVLEGDDFREAVSLDSAVYAPFELPEDSMEEELD